VKKNEKCANNSEIFDNDDLNSLLMGLGEADVVDLKVCTESLLRFCRGFGCKFRGKLD
jgi:hypothetical protein